MAPTTKLKDPAPSSKSGTGDKSGKAESLKNKHNSASSDAAFNSNVETDDFAAHPIATAASRKSGKTISSKSRLNSASSDSAAYSDVEMFSATPSGPAQQEVRQLADKLLGLNNRFAAELSTACERSLLDHSVKQSIAKDIKMFLSKYKATDQAGFVELLGKLVQLVPSENSFENSKTCGRTVRSVNIQDLVETLRSDVNDSLVEIVDCFARELNLQEAQRYPLDQKKASFLARNNAAIDSLEADLKDKLEKQAHPIRFDAEHDAFEADSSFFGSSEDQELLRERNQLKAKVAAMQVELVQSRQYADDVVQNVTRRLEILANAARLIKCEELELVARIANLMKCNLQANAETRTHALKIQELERKLLRTNAAALQDSQKRIDLLEQQLHQLDIEVTALRIENKELQGLGDASWALETEEPSGSRERKDSNDSTGNFKVLDPRSSKSSKPTASTKTIKATFSGAPSRFSTTATAPPAASGTVDERLAAALEILARSQAMPNLPAPNPFSGDFRKDKIGISDFFEMYERRVANCSESDKVSLLSEYLYGEARRAYRSVVSANDALTFNQLCRELKNMMVDTSRTGKLLKMKHFDDLKIRENQTYMSFITLIESQVMDSYGDADAQTVDQVKTKVLLSNLRERDLLMHVETDLRKLEHDEEQFPVVKGLAITYERTAWSSRKWEAQGNQPFSENCSIGTQYSWQGQLLEADCDAPSDPLFCNYCKQAGHSLKKCEILASKNSNNPSSSHNSAQLGNFKTPECWKCGDLGHLAHHCTKVQTSVSSSTHPHSGSSASASACKRKEAVMGAFAASPSPTTCRKNALSFSGNVAQGCTSVRMDEWEQTVNAQNWLTELRKDPYLRESLKLSTDSRARALSDLSLLLENDQLLKVFPDGRKVAYVPKSCRKQVFDKLHASCGHAGWLITVNMVLREYYWQGVRNDIAKWLKMCAVCSSNKSSTWVNAKPQICCACSVHQAGLKISACGNLNKGFGGRRQVSPCPAHS